MPEKLTDAEVKTMLKETKKIAVIGLSPVPARPSYGVTRYMIAQGYEIFGVRPASPPEILGRPCIENLASLNVNVDMINVFRNSDALPELMSEIESWMKNHPGKLKTLWLQEGVTHLEAEKRAWDLGLKVVSDRCILKEHARLTR